MVTQKKTTKKSEVTKDVETTTQKPKIVSDVLTRVVLVFETAVLYFIILFIIFVANNFTVMFFPKG